MNLRSKSKPSLPSPQLTLELARDPQLSAEDFFVSDSNEMAYAMIELWPDWPDPILLLLGPKGSGKSHLGAIWAARAEAQIFISSSLEGLDLAGLRERPALLIEDIDRLGTSETQMFHLINLVRESSGTLVLTASSPPDAWGLTTQDLLSRLRLAPSVTINPPDEGLLRAVLVKLFLDRQLIVDTSLIDYAALRLERSLDAARSFVELLDREALARRQRPSRSMAGEVIAALEASQSEV
jgi:chromosomal replication initiation ATPase DnaA